MVTVLIPWRAGCPHRQRNLGLVLDLYATHHPEWAVVLGEPPPGPWVKAHAVADGLTRTRDDLLVIADADVWCERIDRAVTAVGEGAAWAIPHTELRRLTEAGTDAWLDGDPAPELAEAPYEGQAAGGIFAIRRDVYEDCPFDPAFQGWGNEDASLAYALSCLHSPPLRFDSLMWHLWHPPQERPHRVHGWPEARERRRAYYHARKNPPAMRALIEEAKR